MPAYPPRICLHCGKKFPRQERQYGNQPMYCDEICKVKERIETQKHNGKPKCARCHKRYTRTHAAQRHCPSCQGSDHCKRCGKPVPPPREDVGRATTRNGAKLKLPRKHQYCSRDCQEAAWAETPLPICRYCNRTVDLPVHVYRDPPKVHYKACKSLYEHWIDTLGPEAAYKAWKKANPDTDPPRPPKRKAPVT